MSGAQVPNCRSGNTWNPGKDAMALVQEVVKQNIIKLYELTMDICPPKIKVCKVHMYLNGRTTKLCKIHMNHNVVKC